MLRQLNDYMVMFPYFFEELKNPENSKAERLSYKNRIIDDIKRAEYPKGIMKEMIKAVKAM